MFMPRTQAKPGYLVKPNLNRIQRITILLNHLSQLRKNFITFKKFLIIQTFYTIRNIEIIQILERYFFTGLIAATT